MTYGFVIRRDTSVTFRIQTSTNFCLILYHLAATVMGRTAPEVERVSYEERITLLEEFAAALDLNLYTVALNVLKDTVATEKRRRNRT